MGEGDRRRKGIRRARAVPRKSSKRDKRRQRKTRNFEKAQHAQVVQLVISSTGHIL